MKDDYPNFYLFLSDALRRDHFPDNLKGLTVPAKAAGHHTPVSFTSILTGLTEEEHGVSKFPKSVETPTVFEMEQKNYDVSLWDHPDDVTYKVYRFPPRKPLEELQEPFIFIHRDTCTHAPYCDPTTGEVISWKEATGEADRKWRAEKDVGDFGGGGEGTGRQFKNITGPEYIRKIANKEVDYREHYRRSVQQSVRFFLKDIEKLKELGFYDNTFKVFTSDHGDAWPEDGYQTLAHAAKVPPVMNVAVNFYDHDIEIPENLLNENGDMNIKDILRVWDRDWDNTLSDLRIKGKTEEERKELEEKTKKRLVELGYIEGGEKWRTFVQNRGEEDEDGNVPDEEEMKKRLEELGYSSKSDGEGYENYTPSEE